MGNKKAPAVNRGLGATSIIYPICNVRCPSLSGQIGFAHGARVPCGVRLRADAPLFERGRIRAAVSGGQSHRPCNEWRTGVRFSPT